MKLFEFTLLIVTSNHTASFRLLAIAPGAFIFTIVSWHFDVTDVSLASKPLSSKLRKNTECKKTAWPLTVLQKCMFDLALNVQSEGLNDATE